MSWKKFSSNNSRKGVIENNSKQKNSIYASKVFTDDIIVNNEINVSIIDISNLNYTKNTYKSDSINILEFMHGTDISVNSIGVENNVDTSGVVKIIKPIRGYVGLFNKLKGYDTSFEKLNVNAANVKNISSIYDGSKIEIIGNNVNFNDIVDFNDICMNHFNSNTNNEVIISADISISTQDKSLKIKDVSINTLESRLSTNIIRFDKDISLNRSIFSIGVSADELILSDISVNVIEAKDISVNITNNIDVNGNINVDKINIDFIGSDVSMQNDLSINTDLLCNTMKIHGNIDKFDNNSLLEFTHTVSFEKTLVKSDISATTITFNTGSNKVPTNEIIPDNPSNIITYGLNSYRDNSCIVIDGDVSINGKLDAMWDLTGMNIIPTLTSNFDLINNIDDYIIGQFVILKIIGEPEKIFIKSGEKSWHNLVLGNASPFYTKFELNSSNNDHIFLDETGNIQDNSFTNLQGLEGTNIIFYVQKIFDSSREIFTLDISHNDPEGDSITSFFDNSYNSYLDGDEWGISLEQASSGFDISRVKILPPINNGFDFSFTVTIQDVIIGIPIEQKVTFKKLNRQPDWNYMILSASNSDLLISDQSWNTTSSPSIRDNGDLSNQFYLYFDSCKNYVYSDGIKDLSHYYLDLSALDPEGFDVSYNVSNVKGDLSFGFVDKSRIVIDISDTVVLGSDSSLQIISLDDWTDRPNPEERIVKFKHISSEVIKSFDISENGNSTNTSHNYPGNVFSYVFFKNDITIDISYHDTYNDFFSVKDYSINNIDISSNFNSPTTSVDIDINNNKLIDINNAKDASNIYFSFILNKIFKYDFELDYRPDLIFANNTAMPFWTQYNITPSITVTTNNPGTISTNSTDYTVSPPSLTAGTNVITFNGLEYDVTYNTSTLTFTDIYQQNDTINVGAIGPIIKLLFSVVWSGPYAGYKEITEPDTLNGSQNAYGYELNVTGDAYTFKLMSEHVEINCELPGSPQVEIWHIIGGGGGGGGKGGKNTGSGRDHFGAGGGGGAGGGVYKQTFGGSGLTSFKVDQFSTGGTGGAGGNYDSHQYFPGLDGSPGNIPGNSVLTTTYGNNVINKSMVPTQGVTYDRARGGTVQEEPYYAWGNGTTSQVGGNGGRLLGSSWEYNGSNGSKGQGPGGGTRGTGGTWTGVPGGFSSVTIPDGGNGGQGGNGWVSGSGQSGASGGGGGSATVMFVRLTY